MAIIIQNFLPVLIKKIDKQAIKDSIELVGLDPNSKKHVGKYSLGMRQRLGLGTGNCGKSRNIAFRRAYEWTG